MGKSVLAHMGLLTQADKAEFEQQIYELRGSIKENSSILAERIDELSSHVENIEIKITNISDTIEHIENDIMGMEQVINADGKNIISTLRESFKRASKQIKELKLDSKKSYQLLEHLDNKQVTKDDMEVVASFLRFMAANQLIHEAEEAVVNNQMEIKTKEL